MTPYRFAVGTHDPQDIQANHDGDAVEQAVAIVMARYADVLADNPQDVATLVGPSGLVTRASERVDEFVMRVVPGNLAGTVQPGDSNTPDCNGD